MPSAIIKQVRKRNGSFAPFDQEKITIAIQKAFLAHTGEFHEEDARAITRQVIVALEERVLAAGESDYVPSVEEIQDLVEVGIMERGFFDVAKAYIIYRFEHAKIRLEEQEKIQEKIEKSELIVVKEDGRKELFDVQKIRKTLMRASRGYENDVDIDAILEQCRREVYDGILTRDIAQTLVLVTRSFIELDPAYAHVASRLLLETRIYKDAIGFDPAGTTSFDERYRRAFVENIKMGIAKNLIDSRLNAFDVAVISAALVPERDEELRYLGTQTLADRYFIKDKGNRDRHRFLETPQYMWMRVAMGLAVNEPHKEARAIEFYTMLSTLRFVSSTPTLFHAGTPYPQLSSCYLGVVDDSLESIFNTYRSCAELSKYAGGIGWSWSKIRGTGSEVKKTGLTSNGVVPFLKIADSVTVAINRSGRRRGATCVYLETWHYDIEDFLELRKNTGDDRRRTHDMNTANWIPDLFMKRVRDDGQWTLFSPDETPDLHEIYGKAFEKRYIEYEHMADRGELKIWKRIRARDLWKKMLTQLFETGHPWITFKDPSNVRSPQDHVGVVHSSNLCTEITLNTSPDEEVAVCNLGSINLARHITDRKLDREKIRDTVVVAMRMLDNVIDINYYPTEEARVSNLRHRPVGLGIMGFQDAVFMQDMTFDSEATVAFADESMELISYFTFLASSELARERGAYPTYRGSKWDRGIFPIDTLDLLEAERGEPIQIDRTSRFDWTPVRESVARYGMRNSNCLAMAPTATISNIAGCFPTIEPIYKNIYVKTNISGSFIVVNHYLIEDLKKEGIWNKEMLELIKGYEGDLRRISSIPPWIKEKHKEVFAINPEWLVRAAAHRGKWIDQSQSLNIFYNGSSGKELSDIYQYAWRLGLKTTYYLRTLGASSVEQSTVSLEKQMRLDSSESTRTEIASSEVARVKEEVRAAAETEHGRSVNYSEERALALALESDMPKMVSVEHSPIKTVEHNQHHTSTLPDRPSESNVTHVAVDITAAGANAPKLCLLDDPDCEACQ